MVDVGENNKPQLIGGDFSEKLKGVNNERTQHIINLEQNYPSENVFIPKTEIEQMRVIQSSLREIITKVENHQAECEANPNLHPMIPRIPKGGEEEREILKNIMKQLDGFGNFWAYKFSTGSAESGDTYREPDISDSIYYMTHFGQSLRFKMFNSVVNGEGIRGVIQPFFEYIFFENSDNLRSEVPKLGFTTQEYLSDKFWDIVDGEESGLMVLFGCFSQQNLVN